MSHLLIKLIKLGATTPGTVPPQSKHCPFEGFDAEDEEFAELDHNSYQSTGTRPKCLIPEVRQVNATAPMDTIHGGDCMIHIHIF